MVIRCFAPVRAGHHEDGSYFTTPDVELVQITAHLNTSSSGRCVRRHTVQRPSSDISYGRVYHAGVFPRIKASAKLSLELRASCQASDGTTKGKRCKLRSTPTTHMCQCTEVRFERCVGSANHECFVNTITAFGTCIQ